ncbi:uncharacterized protein PRCAT00004220001 [Priceomyces carsonii]|uniref:uncharacterized protein n=1 Tax=Priceomyces carsonii TaxID=28549 RepID=UPI002EDB25E4|nr:unnamed protein product [Priceomyces carsonii]
MSFLKREKPKNQAAKQSETANRNTESGDEKTELLRLASLSSQNSNKKENSPFTPNYSQEEALDRPPKKHSVGYSEGYSPRTSVVALGGGSSESQQRPPNPSDQLPPNLHHHHHHAHAHAPKISALANPIRPKMKMKSGSLLGKLIYSSRGDAPLQLNTPGSNASRESGVDVPSSAESNKPAHVAKRKSSQGKSLTRHRFKMPSIYSDSVHNEDSETADVTLQNSKDESVATKSTEEDPFNKSSRSFSLYMDPEEMQGIVKSPDAYRRPSTSSRRSSVNTQDDKPPKYTAKRSTNSLATSQNQDKSAWKAPDSWDVKFDNLNAKKFEGLSASESDSDDEKSSEITDTSDVTNEASDDHTRHKSATSDLSGGVRQKYNLPILFGSRAFDNIKQEVKAKGPNHIVRVFKEDNTFTTVLCPLDTSTAELLRIVQRKFFLDSINNYQITVHIGNFVKVLEPFERPLRIQMGLLLLSGYLSKDNLSIIGREDLSFICKFVMQNIHLRNLTHEEEAMLSKDYVDVNISGLDLKTIPIIFHQHTYEIEKLNVANNPSIYIPLDFIQSSTNLNTLIFSNNGCSKFPINFLEAKKLTNLDMEINFLDELPSKINYLENLTHLKLNSNQLSTLPKSFGKLVNLVSLNLSTNYFRNFPEQISELVNLEDLNLSYNNLSSIPESMGKLVNLRKLNLCTNKLSKSLPSCFSKLTSLQRLDIRYNSLSSVDVLESLPNLEIVHASKNNIFTFSDKMESLRLLNFDRNPITNFKFENLMPVLTVLDLSKAKITSLPSDFISRINNIEKLILDKNHIVSLPNELGYLSKLTFLSIYGNNLQLLPSTIGQLTSLQYLDLHSNNLQVLPDDIWNLKSLSVLNVSSNILSGLPKPPLSVAKRISSSANFRSFFSSARLTPNATPDQSRRPSVFVDNLQSPKSHGTDMDDTNPNTSSIQFPSTTFSMADSLLVLTLADNRLTDDCFDSISFLLELKYLNLSYNDIVEISEGAFRRLTKLTELYMSGNELTTLPADDLEALKVLKLLFLNNNKLVSLPAELSKLSDLEHLDVGSNQLKYNISNWPYDWNWYWNKNLKYLNFSGNKRFEIKQSHIKNPETGEFFDSLLVLKDLKVLGLIDVTLTTTAVPDQSVDLRIRTTSSELPNVGYGVSDSMGVRENVSNRDVFIQKFRGNENEVLLCTFDGRNGVPNQGHRIAQLARQIFVPNFTNELNKLKPEEQVQDAIRRTFLSLNREVNGILSAKKSGGFTPNPQASGDILDLSFTEDSNPGCSITMVYICGKKLYVANIGDTEALLSKSNGEYVLLTSKHDPTQRSEFERIKAAGGYVSGDGALDGMLSISRGAGFFNFLPHTHSGPDIKEIALANVDDMIVVATNVLWNQISYELADDILRQEKDDPMIAAQKLRDYAICYGANDKVAVLVLTLGEQKSKKFGSNALYNNLGRESEIFASRKRRDKIQPGDSNLRRLEEEIDPPVGELALVFTDIKNSTLLWDTYPVPMRSAIKIHNSIMRRQLRIVGGYEVKTEGDAFMVSFSSPTSALLWCFNVQQKLMAADWPAEILETDHCCEITDEYGNIIFRGLSVRMGIHWGAPVCEPDIVTGRMDYFGPMVNRAARINAVADGGQICVSSDFLDEMKSLYKIHESIVDKRATLSEAYEGNVRAGEIIEKEINALEEIGCSYFDIGEKKLKGLETPELITLVYPKKLEMRFEIFQKSFKNEDSQAGSTRVIGTLPVNAIYNLRDVSLLLENICSRLSGGLKDTFETQPLDVITQHLNYAYKEKDFIALLNHVTTRIENCVTNLYIRQQMGILQGNHGRIDFCSVNPIYDIMTELADYLNTLQALKAANEVGPDSIEPSP